jgi:hypothetical protein
MKFLEKWHHERFPPHFEEKLSKSVKTFSSVKKQKSLAIPLRPAA